MIIREGGVGVLAGVEWVYSDAVRSAYTAILSPTALHGMLTSGWHGLRRGHRLIVAVDEPGIVGFVDVGPGEEPGVGYVYGLFVSPQQQGSGIGRQLMAAAHHAMDELGLTRRLLWVLEGNDRAMAFYKRGDWRRDGERVLSSRGVNRLRFEYSGPSGSG